MTFTEVCKTYFFGFMNFRGVASRSEFWWRHVAYFLVPFAFLFFVAALDLLNGFTTGSMASRGASEAPLEILFGGIYLFGALWIMAFLIFWSIPLTVRRIKDTGISGWWYLPAAVIPAMLHAVPSLDLMAYLLDFLIFIYIGFSPTGFATSKNRADLSHNESTADPKKSGQGRSGKAANNRVKNLLRIHSDLELFEISEMSADEAWAELRRAAPDWYTKGEKILIAGLEDEDIEDLKGASVDFDISFTKSISRNVACAVVSDDFIYADEDDPDTKKWIARRDKVEECGVPMLEVEEFLGIIGKMKRTPRLSDHYYSMDEPLLL